MSADDVPLLADLDRPVHAVILESGDVHEDDAGARLASAVAGPGLAIRGPSFSRYNLLANTKGLLRVDADALLRLNRLPGVAIFTLEDRIPVVPGKIVTGVKVTPVAVTEATLLEAEAIAAEGPGGSGRTFPPTAGRGDQHRGSRLASAGQISGIGLAKDRLVWRLGHRVQRLATGCRGHRR